MKTHKVGTYRAGTVLGKVDAERLEKYMEVEGRTSIGEAVRNILHDYLKDWEKEQIELMKE